MRSLCLFCLLGTVAWVGNASAQVIVSVTAHPERSTSGFAQGVQDRQLTKFREELPVDDEVIFDVQWEAPPEGLTRPLTVQMRLKQVARPQAWALAVAYESGTRGRHIARFRVTGQALRDYGEVTAWRVELIVDGRAVDQRVQGRWMGQTNGRRR